MNYLNEEDKKVLNDLNNAEEDTLKDAVDHLARETTTVGWDAGYFDAIFEVFGGLIGGIIIGKIVESLGKKMGNAYVNDKYKEINDFIEK